LRRRFPSACSGLYAEAVGALAIFQKVRRRGPAAPVALCIILKTVITQERAVHALVRLADYVLAATVAVNHARKRRIA